MLIRYKGAQRGEQGGDNMNMRSEITKGHNGSRVFMGYKGAQEESEVVIHMDMPGLRSLKAIILQ